MRHRSRSRAHHGSDAAVFYTRVAEAGSRADGSSRNPAGSRKVANFAEIIEPLASRHRDTVLTRQRVGASTGTKLDALREGALPFSLRLRTTWIPTLPARERPSVSRRLAIAVWAIRVGSRSRMRRGRRERRPCPIHQSLQVGGGDVAGGVRDDNRVFRQ